ncbi:hypothetical protein DFH07DRAFT_824009 [Mycena maculata]|uniref:Uncharacterized protein n=1 Tax=Mycena maculata TaxID=230809 RepID=A0AAD7J0N0_9AGAR|nr:hypothetical protein DFH07DRAFT_824009 [Mycena maculata]
MVTDTSEYPKHHALLTWSEDADALPLRSWRATRARRRRPARRSRGCSSCSLLLLSAFPVQEVERERERVAGAGVGLVSLLSCFRIRVLFGPGTLFFGSRWYLFLPGFAGVSSKFSCAAIPLCSSPLLRTFFFAFWNFPSVGMLDFPSCFAEALAKSCKRAVGRLVYSLCACPCHVCD